MVKINYYKIAAEDHSFLDKLIDRVPLFMKQKLLSYHLPEDRLRGVIGKLILRKLLMEEEYPPAVLEQIKQDTYGRPFIDKSIDFNIAHSGDYILCVVSKDTKVGVDIEKIRNVKMDDFNIALSSEEFDELKNHASPGSYFFSIWTQKEAVSKANGKGMEVILTDIIFKNNKAISENEEWMLKELEINNNYKSHVAFKGINDVLLMELELKDLSGIV